MSTDHYETQRVTRVCTDGKHYQRVVTQLYTDLRAMHEGYWQIRLMNADNLLPLSQPLFYRLTTAEFALLYK